MLRHAFQEGAYSLFYIKKEPVPKYWPLHGAVDEIRTRDIHLGKVALYH